MYRLRIIIYCIVLSICANLSAEPILRYVFPVPNSTDHPRQTPIIIRFNCLSEMISNRSSFIQVSHLQNMTVAGEIKLSTDNHTMIFIPNEPYTLQDTVNVRLTPILEGEIDPSLDSTFQFITESGEYPLIKNLPVSNGIQTRSQSVTPTIAFTQDPEIVNGIAIPADFPKIDILVNESPDSSLIFFSMLTAPFYQLILDNSGAPVWIGNNGYTEDFKCQVNGMISYFTPDLEHSPAFFLMDSTYTVIDTIQGLPGYVIDEHDFLITETGHRLIITQYEHPGNRSEIAPIGNDAIVLWDRAIIELDRLDLPIFIWRSQDHFDPKDAIHEDLDLLTYIDYSHINSIAIDLDQHLLISSRNQDEITKINRETGEIIWRLGGQHDDYQWLNDNDRIYYQHDIHVLPNGHYTLFDNGTYHSPRYSRGLELVLDPIGKTVTKVWEYRHKPDIHTILMGNMQVLPNDNRLICWSSQDAPIFTEVQLDGSKVFEIAYQGGDFSYRAHRFSWTGCAKRPSLIFETYLDRITLIFNQFGKKDIAYYQIYADTVMHPNQIITTTTQPFYHVMNGIENGKTYYFRVTSIDTNGNESQFSNEESRFFQVYRPDVNFVKNGGFSRGKKDWRFLRFNGASAEWSAEDSLMHITIGNSGSELSDLIFYQMNIPIIRGRSYRITYEAYSTEGRAIDINIFRKSVPKINYSKLGSQWIDEKKTIYSSVFKMEDLTDPISNLEFRVGMSNEDVYLDNISLIMLDDESSVSPANSGQSTSFTLYPNYPNPFNSSTTLRFTLKEKSRVTIHIYDCLGRFVECLHDANLESGEHKIQWNAAGYATGLYFAKIEIPGSVNVQKLFLIK